MKNSNIPALSIIVPIYNVEKYLSECLESILCQNFDFSFEIILVNDGATDGSKKIAKSYSNNYPDKFIYLEQVNKGLSAARNSGLNISKGQYVLFLDSDDCLSNTGLSDLVHKAMNQNLDIMVGNFINFYEDSSEFKNKKIVQSDTEIGEAWLTKSLSQRKFMPAVWFKLYRRSFLLDQNIMFVDGLINEDQLYSILTFVKAMNVSSIDIPFYRYRHRSGSISKVLDMKSAIRRVESDLYTASELIELSSKMTNGKLVSLILSRVVKLLGSSFLTLYNAEGLDKKILENYIKKVDSYSLHRFIRFSRASHIIDWFMLRKGFESYLKWRTFKW